jgi:hypothetical protein
VQFFLRMRKNVLELYSLVGVNLLFNPFEVFRTAYFGIKNADTRLFFCFFIQKRATGTLLLLTIYLLGSVLEQCY